MLADSKHHKDDVERSGKGYIDVERDTSRELANHTTLDPVDSLTRKDESVTVRKTKRATSSTGTGQVFKNPAKQPGKFQQRHVGTFSLCLLLSCLLITLCSGTQDGIASRKRSSSATGDYDKRHVSTFPSTSSPITSAAKGEVNFLERGRYGERKKEREREREREKEREK